MKRQKKENFLDLYRIILKDCDPKYQDHLNELEARQEFSEWLKSFRAKAKKKFRAS